MTSQHGPKNTRLSEDARKSVAAAAQLSWQPRRDKTFPKMENVPPSLENKKKNDDAKVRVTLFRVDVSFRRTRDT